MLWRETQVKDLPQQINSSDCGVFVCIFTDRVSVDRKTLKDGSRFDFDGSNMAVARNRLASLIGNKKFLENQVLCIKQRRSNRASPLMHYETSLLAQSGVLMVVYLNHDLC